MTDYVIWRTPGAGFFSIVASTLAYFDLASSRGLTPVVDFQNHDSVYRENHPVHGTMNMWEYYFEQPSGKGVESLAGNFVPTDGTWPKGYPYSLTGSPIYPAMWKRFVKLNGPTRRFVDSSCESLQVSEQTLGVHFRGQEMRTARGHHYPPTIRQTTAAIRWNLENYNFDEIFLVTEAQQYVRYFLKSFGNRVIPSPSFRLSYQNSYQLKKAPRRNHRYLLGLEALRDAVALSKCGGIVCGHSNLSEAALMLAGENLITAVRIMQGRNSFRPYVAPVKWYLKAALPKALGGFLPWDPEKQSRRIV